MEILSFADLQQIIAIKVVFFIFIVFGIFAIRKKIDYGPFLFIIGMLLARAYFALSQGTQLMFWGMQGDENFISALYYAGAHSSFFADFAYSNLPAFYPPLFFWFFGIFGKIFDWNGIQIAKLANLSVFFFFPVIFYYIQELFWKKHKSNNTPGSIAWFVSALLLFVFVDTDAIILKQYEFVSASLVVLWTIFFIHLLHSNKLNRKNIIVLGITGGLLFMSFYFWFFFSAIGVAVFNLFSGKKITGKQYLHTFLVGFLILLFSSPFWFPLAKIYLTSGAENFQLGYTTIERLLLHAPFVELSIKGILALFGFGTLVFYVKKVYARSVLVLFSIPYIWQTIGLFTILFFASPLQESKGFMFWNGAVLALAVGYGIERIWNKYAVTRSEEWRTVVTVIGLILVGTQLIFGTFSNSYEVLGVHNRAKEFRPGIVKLIGFFEGVDLRNSRILTSGIPELHATLPVDDFLYYNQHYSHPGANFSQRFYYIKDATQIDSSKKLWEVTQSSEWGEINYFVFYKGVNEGYPLYFHLDNFPNGLKEETLLFSKELFQSEYFEKVHENGHYVVFRAKQI